MGKRDEGDLVEGVGGREVKTLLGRIRGGRDDNGEYWKEKRTRGTKEVGEGGA